MYSIKGKINYNGKTVYEFVTKPCMNEDNAVVNYAHISFPNMECKKDIVKLADDLNVELSAVKVDDKEMAGQYILTFAKDVKIGNMEITYLDNLKYFETEDELLDYKKDEREYNRNILEGLKYNVEHMPNLDGYGDGITYWGDNYCYDNPLKFDRVKYQLDRLKKHMNEMEKQIKELERQMALAE